MFIAAHERAQPAGVLDTPPRLADTRGFPAQAGDLAVLYRQLSSTRPDEAATRRAAEFLREQMSLISREDSSGGLPDTPQELDPWMQKNVAIATDQYSAYLEERKAGAPRRFFSNRAHALFFLRTVSPTKLVDGAWLYGLVTHWRNPRFHNLLRIYLEELGEGAPDKNHVVLYRQLLASHGLEPNVQLEDRFYVQGLIQLALAFHADEFLPEIIGFNLAYEQLPLHLLITAYELNELGLDPYYFTLHVTVDNPDTGHARRAVQAVLDNLPQIGDAGDFWQRVRKGAALADAGTNTTAVIERFDIEAEVIRILSQKSHAGHGAHSDYCRIAGRHVNEWLAHPDDIPDFLQALQKSGWIKLGQPVSESRFWGLLQGDRAEMFGVFSSYELQVIHDWILGAASAAGHAYGDPATGGRPPGFRAAARLAAARGEISGANASKVVLDGDLQALQHRLNGASCAERHALMVDALSPSQHWTPAGLHATRIFCGQWL
jgi:hypothetical protein